MADFPQVVAGTTLAFGVRDAEAGASATCTYAVRGEGHRSTKAATRNGDEWEASFAASTTAAWPVGEYEFQALRTEGTKVKLIDSGRFELIDKIATSAGRMVRQSFAEKALECVEAVLLDHAGDGAVSVSVGDQSYSFESRLDLLAFRERLREEVARERRGPPVRTYRWSPS